MKLETAADAELEPEVVAEDASDVVGEVGYDAVKIARDGGRLLSGVEPPPREPVPSPVDELEAEGEGRESFAPGHSDTQLGVDPTTVMFGRAVGSGAGRCDCR